MSEESPYPTPEPANPASTPPPTPVNIGKVEVPGGAPVYSKEQTDKKIIAGVLAIVLGAFGVHKLFLGYTVEGITMLVIGLAGFLLCGFPTMAVGIVGLIEGILYLTKTDSEFVETYLIGRKTWF